MRGIDLDVRRPSCRSRFVLWTFGRLLMLGSWGGLVGCGDDDAPMDAGHALDGSFDASVDATSDGGVDARVEDTGAVDADDVTDGPDAAPPDVASLDEVAAVLCPAIARVRCTTPTACACPRFGSFELDECLGFELSDCRVALENRTRGDGIADGRVATDLTALASCTAALETSYARCTGSIVDLEARCLPSFLDLDADLGDGCADALCAGGEGVCSREDGRCRARPALGHDR